MQNNIAKWDEHFSPRSKTLFAFFAGLYFALLQFCYFFMLEAYLSSRALSFFVALFFWLIGFLAGLNITNKSIFFRLLLVSALSYYIALLGNFLFPYKLGMLAFTGVAITLSGLAPGYFFIFQKKSFLKIKLLFFHENNGFVAGVVVCLLTVVFYGKWLLYFGPLAGLVSVWLCETKKPDPPDTQTGKYSSFMMLGVHLGIVQISAYFTIQCFVTATFFAYFALLISWMAGAIFNLKFALPKTLSHSLLLSTVAYFFLLLLVTQFPPFPGLYPVLVLLLFLLSAPAGAFFRENSSKTPPHSLFFHENNGFVIGNIVTLLAFLKWGVYFLYLGPLLSWAGWFLLRQKSPLSALLFFFSILFFSFFSGSTPLFYLLIFMLLTGAAAFLVKPEFQGEEEEEKKPTLATKHKLALFIAGINLTLLQYFITREFSSLLSANELTILIVASAYFVGFSIGYGLSRFFSLRFLQITAPVLFLLHFCIFLTLKFIAGYFIRAGFNLEVLVLLLFVASFLTSSFYSMLLPRFISSAGRNSLISYYSWELMGAITGAATMFFVIVRFPTILWPIYFALFLILIFLLTPKSRFFPAYLAIGIFLIAFQFRYQERISHLVTEDYYQTRGYRNPRLLFSGNSFYHSIDVLDTYREKTRTRKERRTSFINGIRYFSYKFDESGNFDKETSLSEFTYFLAELPARYLHQELGRKLRILILGGGSLYSIARVNEFAERTTLVEIDPLVIESSTKYWKNINRLEEMETAEIIIDDAKHYLKTSSEKFDLIVMDISAPYYLGTMLLHNRSFFELVKKRLKPGGIFSESTQSRPKPNRFNSSAMKILKGVVDVFPHYRVLDAYKKPRGRRGFVYASSSFPFSTEKLNTILKKDGLFRGTALYSPENHHYNFDKVTPFSLTNMETLLTGNMGRFKRRLSLEQRLHSKSFFKKRKRRLRRMEFHSLDYVTQIFKENFFLLGALSAAFFSLIGFFYYGKRAEKEAL